MAMPKGKLFMVFYTWVDNNGVRKAGHSDYNATSASDAIKQAKGDHRPYKLQNLVAKIYSYPIKYPAIHKAVKAKEIKVRNRY